ncbi:MAG: glycosyltransferase family 2 protein [Saprospiraceae bacterium]
MKPFFSIVIPTYNRAKLIKNTINNILNQTFQNFEIIIVDDGSTDNTSEVIQKEFDGNNKIKYFKKHNEERGKARNYGYVRAKGEYVVFFDSDDIMLPHNLEILYDGIKREHPNFIASQYIIVDENGVKTGKGTSNKKSGRYTYKDFLKGNFLACHFGVKRENVNIRLFEEDRKYSILEDWMFLISNLQKDELLLESGIGVYILDHSNRSMSDNQLVIRRRLAANEKLNNSHKMSRKQNKIMNAYSYYFCAIHAYLDSERKQSLSFLYKAILEVGIQFEFVILFIKAILSYSIIKKIRSK